MRINLYEFILYIAFFVNQINPLLAKDTTSRIRIDITDYFGTPLILNDGSIQSKDANFKIPHDGILMLRPGEYTVEMNVQGFRRLVASFVVSQPEQVISLAMPLGSIDGPNPTCSLNGKSDLDQRNSKVRLISQFGNIGKDVPVQAHGNFFFENLECGDYVLLGIEKNHCTEAMQLRITEENMRVKLSANKQSCLQTERKIPNDNERR